jgi:hypothetical protein
LIISSDLTLNYERRLNFIKGLYEIQIIARKLRCLFLLVNLEWIEVVVKGLYTTIFVAAIYSFFDTFYDAISEKQAVFTLTVLANNFILNLVNLNYLDDKLRYLLSVTAKVVFNVNI